MNLIYEGSVKDIYQLEKNEELLLNFRIGFQFLIGEQCQMKYHQKVSHLRECLRHFLI